VNAELSYYPDDLTCLRREPRRGTKVEICLTQNINIFQFSINRIPLSSAVWDLKQQKNIIVQKGESDGVSRLYLVCK
jgi:hypothetical protein